MKARSAAKALTTLAVSVAALTGPLAPAASATDIYGIANGCYALKESYSGKYVVRAGNNYTATAATAAAATPFRLQATALGRYLLYGPGGAMPAVSLLGQVQATTKPGPTADWRFEYVSKTLRLVNVSNGARAGRERRRPAHPRSERAGPVERGARAGLRHLPRDSGERDGHPAEGRDPHVAGPRLLRRPHPPRGVRVPRRALPLRPPLEPLRRDRGARGLRRPLPQRRGRGVRELPLRRQPGGNPLDRGMAQLRRLAARRVADP